MKHFFCCCSAPSQAFPSPPPESRRLFLENPLLLRCMHIQGGYVCFSSLHFQGGLFFKISRPGWLDSNRRKVCFVFYLLAEKRGKSLIAQGGRRGEGECGRWTFRLLSILSPESGFQKLIAERLTLVLIAFKNRCPNAHL